MKHLKSINHIGYAVQDIQKTAQYYLDAGWQLSIFFEEEIQQSKIAFLTKEGYQKMEIVAPLKEDSPSPVDTYLQKIGCNTYHVCYDVDDIEQVGDDLFDEEFKPLFEPVESVAMEGYKNLLFVSSSCGFDRIG